MRGLPCCVDRLCPALVRGVAMGVEREVWREPDRALLEGTSADGCFREATPRQSACESLILGARRSHNRVNRGVGALGWLLAEEVTSSSILAVRNRNDLIKCKKGCHTDLGIRRTAATEKSNNRDKFR